MLWEKPISPPQEEITDFLLFMQMHPWLLAAEKLCTPAASSSEKELVVSLRAFRVLAA